jgi:biopolymer transport protein TolQ
MFDRILQRVLPCPVCALWHFRGRVVRHGIPFRQPRTADASEASLHTLGSLILALQVQEGAPPVSGTGGGVIDIISQTGPLNLAVFAILLLFSITSWSIILSKALAFQKVGRQTAAFLDVFRRSQKFSEVQAVCPTLPASPLVGVFQAGYAELNAQFRATETGIGNGPNPAGTAQRPMLKSLDAVDRALIRASTTEVNKLERKLTFLATTASITPFIGLFGTVVGIMIAFRRIGATGSTNLAIVAPGISEALIATAAGLFAAIPATYFYNHFTHRVKEFSADMDDFSLEFLNISERNFT